MHISESESAKPRYGEHAVEAFKDADVLWEQAEHDYSGSVALIFRLPNSQYGFYEWSYGSCSGCDAWEARDLSTDAIVDEMRSQAAFFPDSGRLLAWLDMTDSTGALCRPKRADVEALVLAAAESPHPSPRAKR